MRFGQVFRCEIDFRRGKDRRRQVTSRRRIVLAGENDQNPRRVEFRQLPVGDHSHPVKQEVVAEFVVPAEHLGHGFCGGFADFVVDLAAHRIGRTIVGEVLLEQLLALLGGRADFLVVSVGVGKILRAERFEDAFALRLVGLREPGRGRGPRRRLGERGPVKFCVFVRPGGIFSPICEDVRRKD